MTAIEQLPRVQREGLAPAVAALARGGTRLYSVLGAGIAEDPELLEIASHALAPVPGLHLLAIVHYLLMHDTADPLAQYYETLTDHPAPADEAVPHFARFCGKHREEILELMRTRTVQATNVERCVPLMPMFSQVAKLTGEPLNLIEIGCSAGILLTFDKYAYDLNGRGRVGAEDAALTLKADLRGGSDFHIPQIGKRVGLDLRPVDVKLADERRWLLAQLEPGRRELHATLSAALDVVARTEISFFQGDALDLLAEQIAATSGPLCIYHSACVVYWSDEAKARLDALLRHASRGREFYRLQNEPDMKKAREQGQDFAVELVMTRYKDGAADSRIAGHFSPLRDFTTLLD
ncbi:MAG TPA: DUF2332 domain-containing protein [Rhizomicrobium sp.]|nr:DUF2332 domain-containing protein [Rhizomicrobium sp.]